MCICCQETLQPLTCDQVGEGPHRALQLRRRSGVSPHVLRVALVEAAQFVDVLLDVRHFRCSSVRTDKHAPRVAAVSGKHRLHPRLHKFRTHLPCEPKQNFRVDEPTLIYVPHRSRAATLWFRFRLLAYSAELFRTRYYCISKQPFSTVAMSTSGEPGTLTHVYSFPLWTRLLKMHEKAAIIRFNRCARAVTADELTLALLAKPSRGPRLADGLFS